MSFSQSIVEVKLSGNKYNDEQSFFQKYSTLSDDLCVVFQRAVYLACKECMLFVEAYFSSKGFIYIRNSITKKILEHCMYLLPSLYASYRTTVQISLQIEP